MISTGFGLEPNTFHITHSDGPALFLSLPVFELDGQPVGTYGALVEGPVGSPSAGRPSGNAVLKRPASRTAIGAVCSNLV